MVWVFYQKLLLIPFLILVFCWTSLPLLGQAPHEPRSLGLHLPSTILIDSTFRLHYLYGGRPSTLGPQDQLEFSTPFHEITMETKTPQGVRALVTHSLIHEYHLPHIWNIEFGRPKNPTPFENNSVTQGFLQFPLFTIYY